MSPIILNSAGLVFDIVGAVLIWIFVVEINFASKEKYLKGNAAIELFDPTPDKIAAYKRNVLMSRVGMVSLIIGFILQLASNFCK